MISPWISKAQDCAVEARLELEMMGMAMKISRIFFPSYGHDCQRL